MGPAKIIRLYPEECGYNKYIYFKLENPENNTYGPYYFIPQEYGHTAKLLFMAFENRWPITLMEAKDCNNNIITVGGHTLVAYINVVLE